MSEFYEVLTPEMISIMIRLKIFPMECMICYDPCNKPGTVAVLPCFHMLHIDCANKTIEMAFRRAIHPNTILATWEFHCPQYDSSESLTESARLIKRELGRCIKPSIPRCENIPIPNQEIEHISYFSLPYVQNWYKQNWYKQKSVSKKSDSSIFSILIFIGILYLLPQSVWILFLCYQICKLIQHIRDYTQLFHIVGSIFIMVNFYQIYVEKINS
jgi:hypothetical protein